MKITRTASHDEDCLCIDCLAAPLVAERDRYREALIQLETIAASEGFPTTAKFIRQALDG